MLAATLLTLASKDRGRLRTLVFLGGSGITLVVLGALALAGGKGIRMELPKPSLISTIVDIILGGLLIYIGHRKIFKKPKDARLKVQYKTKIFAKPGLLASFGLGFVITVTDFSSLVLYLAAAKQSIDADVSSTVKVAAMSMMAGFIMLPIIAPFLLTLIAPETAALFLDRINIFIRKYSRYITAVICLIFGLFLVGKGLLQVY